MLGFKETLSDLQNDTVKVMQCLSRLLMSNSESKVVVEKKIDDYLCELENLCVKSMVFLMVLGCQERSARTIFRIKI